MSNDKSDQDPNANSPNQPREENTASRQPTINRRHVLLGTTAIGAAAALPPAPDLTSIPHTNQGSLEMRTATVRADFVRADLGGLSSVA